MLSIIVSSYNSAMFEALQKNIEETIGIKYEIIKIHNPGLMGICTAYNKGASLANYENLLFVHEDVIFKSINWGKILIEKYFTLEKVGVLGLAGAKKKFHLPYGWGYPNDNEKFVFVSHPNDSIINYNYQSPIKIKVIDGVFLALKKDVWAEIKFDENIEGFHFYDIDISLRASEQYNNYIIPDIALFHHSHGNYNNNWMKSAIQLNKKNYKNYDKCTQQELTLIRQMWYKRLRNKNIQFSYRIIYLKQIS